ncbi:MAG TPA: tetratricopeptide repeat protein [Gaiellaceae bacterium]|nr:tetratricopeptide repeat protein [Gaiellaceae bacterium]
MTRTTKLLLLLTAVIAAGFAALFGGALRETQSAASAEIAQAEQQVEDFQAGFKLNASTAELVQALQAKLGVDQKDERAWLLLGLAYQQRARETGDPTYYSKSEGSLRRALALDPKDSFVYSGLGSLALSRHRFEDALRLGEEAHRLAPTIARHYGVTGDALIELGRYPQAFHEFDVMNRLLPDLSSYARVSYGRELRGDTAGAIKSMRLAIDAATGAREPTAWTHVQLGKLYYNHGRYADALREFRLANRLFPSYAYGLDAQAQAEWALGRTPAAIALEREAVDLIPLPQYVAFLGDLYTVTGHRVLARREYSLIGAIERLLRANGVRVDLEIALFDVDHGIRLRRALALARSGRAARPSIDGDDVLAWALARTGQCDKALRYSRHALRLGTQDALKFFHRGMIERCLGHRVEARTWFRRAIALNPGFSVLWSPVARRYAS